jgi:hypothetical protein
MAAELTGSVVMLVVVGVIVVIDADVGNKDANGGALMRAYDTDWVFVCAVVRREGTFPKRRHRSRLALSMYTKNATHASLSTLVHRSAHWRALVTKTSLATRAVMSKAGKKRSPADPSCAPMCDTRYSSSAGRGSKGPKGPRLANWGEVVARAMELDGAVVDVVVVDVVVFDVVVVDVVVERVDVAVDVVVAASVVGVSSKSIRVYETDTVFV